MLLREQPLAVQFVDFSQRNFIPLLGGQICVDDLSGPRLQGLPLPQCVRLNLRCFRLLLGGLCRSAGSLLICTASVSQRTVVRLLVDAAFF